jgi:tetratricopeptide (TPR) repeat protein
MNKGALAVIFGLSLIAFRFSDVQAQIISKEPPEVVEVFDAMYRYNLPEAEKKFKKLYQTNLDPNLIDLTQANLFWWWLISGDNSRDYDHQMSVILHRIIDRLSQKPVDKMSEEEIFTMIHSYAYLTRVDIYLERYFTGMVNLKRTLDYLKIALENSEKYDKYMLVSGLYNYFSAVTVAKYPVFAPFFALAPRSDRTKGFDLLNRCARMDNILIKNESLYYLMKINYQLEDDYKRSLDIANELIRRYPNNLIYHYHKFSILIEAGKKDEAREAYASLFKTSANAPGLNALQRNHLTDIARKRLLKEKINPAI